MKFRPLHDWVLLKPSQAAEATRGGIVIPDVAREKPQEGEVIAVGEGRWEKEKEDRGKAKGEKKFVKTSLKPGDRVLYEKYMERKVEVNNEELVLVREENVLGLIEKSG